MWRKMSESEHLPQKFPGLYKKMSQQKTVHDNKILKDVSRTYPQYQMFRDKNGPGQQALLNILRAYAFFDRGLKVSI